MSQSRANDGTFAQKVSDEEIVAALEEDGSLSRDVQEEVGLARSTVIGRLADLEEEGRVRREDIVGTSIWHPVK